MKPSLWILLLIVFPLSLRALLRDLSRSRGDVARSNESNPVPELRRWKTVGLTAVFSAIIPLWYALTSGASRTVVTGISAFAASGAVMFLVVSVIEGWKRGGR
jgi:predicted secreted protein